MTKRNPFKRGPHNVICDIEFRKGKHYIQSTKQTRKFRDVEGALKWVNRITADHLTEVLRVQIYDEGKPKPKPTSVHNRGNGSTGKTTPENVKGSK